MLLSVRKVSRAKYLLILIAFFIIFEFSFLRVGLKYTNDESDSPRLHTIFSGNGKNADSCFFGVDDNNEILPLNVSVNKHMKWAQVPFQDIFRRRQYGTKPICDEQSLLQHSVKYYVYPPQLLFSNSRYYFDNLTYNELGTDPRILPFRHRYDARFEIDIFLALQHYNNNNNNHSLLLRVDNYQDAALVVLPVPFGAMYYDIKTDITQKNELFAEIWNNLKVQPAFVEGKPHVLVSMTNPIFSFVHMMYVVNEGLDVFYKNVESVSVARGDDHFATRYVLMNNVTSSKKSNNDFRGYDDLFAKVRPVTNFTFCVGLGGQAMSIPLAIPTWEKFQNSSYFIFYHTRKTPSDCNSTPFRHAPVINVSWSALPPTSVGWDLHPTRWAKYYTTSKFCLVIRGDTPHSHALFNAVKAGCIPVVISDWYPFYSPPFPATLDMRDFCIFISEEDFIQNPEKELSALQNLPDNVIRSKLLGLAWAQRVMIVDHPQSLFAPAFVREAMASFSRPFSEVLHPGEKVS